MSVSSDGSNVVTLSRNGFGCAVPGCESAGAWQVIGKVENRSCAVALHLGVVAEATPTDGWQPLVLVRISPRGDVA